MCQYILNSLRGIRLIKTQFLFSSTLFYIDELRKLRVSKKKSLVSILLAFHQQLSCKNIYIVKSSSKFEPYLFEGIYVVSED